MGIEPTQDASTAPPNGFEDCGVPPMTIRKCALRFDPTHLCSASVGPRPLTSASLAVILAVSHPVGRGDEESQGRLTADARECLD
jgi:hypothetical protein